jgi:hypothetical protein
MFTTCDPDETRETVAELVRHLATLVFGDTLYLVFCYLASSPVVVKAVSDPHLPFRVSCPRERSRVLVRACSPSCAYLTDSPSPFLQIGEAVERGARVAYMYDFLKSTNEAANKQ